jgi:hypothetical protein
LGAAKMNRVLFQYKADTMTATLLRHHRIARWIMYACGFFSLLMLSSIAQGLLTRFDSITIALATVSVCFVVLLVIPACFSLPWIRDIEVELTKRGAAIPGGRDSNRRIVATTGKMMFWAVTIVAGSVLIRKLMDLIARHAGGG